MGRLIKILREGHMKKINLLILAIFMSGCAANVQTSSSNQGPKESVAALSGMVIGGALANDMAGAVSYTHLTLPTKA